MGGGVVSGGDVLDLFSAAAGGWSLGMHRAGFRTVAACEVEAWRRALYAENNPHVRLYDDVRTLTADRLRADLGRLPAIVVGSPPCQDISSANTKGRGVEGARSGLYFEAVRIIGEVRPRWFALENSANLRTRGYDAVRAALEAIGYACWPCVVRAGDIGANHDRARCWLIGCDLDQVADADGIGREEGWSWGRGGFDVSVPCDLPHTDDESELCGTSHAEVEIVRGLGGDCRGYEASDPAQDGCGPRLSGRCVVAAERLPVEACRDVADAHSYPVRLAIVSRGPESEAPVTGDVDPRRNAPDADQARQAHGCVEPSLRQAEIADDGRGAGWRNDGSRAGQVGLRASDRSDVIGGRSSWTLANLADHLRLDDGVSARLAGTRIAVGDGTGQSAASLIVEAFGDAVVPQIPEAIGRAILRTERALAAIYGLAA